MLSQLAFDPALTQKRLGDGFYEQRLIREQVAQLTGRRFLVGYADDEAQYQALMTNGVTFAQQYQHHPIHRERTMRYYSITAVMIVVSLLIPKLLFAADLETYKNFRDPQQRLRKIGDRLS